MNAAPQTRVTTADASGIALAARILADGGLVAFPTETVYGLGALARDAGAVARLYAAKGRPRFNPLIAHVADLAAARALAQFGAVAERLAAAFWPGPLTLVLPKRANAPVAEIATCGLPTIGVRVPRHAVAHELLARLDGPLVAPSANRSGHVSPTSAAHVLADLRGRVDLVLDGGASPVGIESTIVAALEATPLLLRPGGIARAAIERVLGAPLLAPTAAHDPSHAGGQQAPLAPGMLAAHYAPRARLRQDVCDVRDGEALLAFGARRPAGAEWAVAELNLSAAGDLIEAAANLFSHLRQLDASGAATIAVMPVPRMGLGEAINDRLTRAGAPRR